ncbi:kanadaptin [Rhipicephalus sanguineus]|uniref:kanadaptin n=1 Tax=Rhipicephalus sanguineus TaxID=34632 RepID=UPI0018940F96|nr:kanadaptin [Rhipicephalus sanguineus]
MDSEVSTTTESSQLEHADEEATAVADSSSVPVQSDNGAVSSSSAGDSNPEPMQTDGEPADGSEVSSSKTDSSRASFKMPLIGPRPGKQKVLTTGIKPLAQCIELPSPSSSAESGEPQETAESATSSSKPTPTDAPYNEPPWSGVPDREYKFQVLKAGVIVSNFPLDKPYIVIGRKDDCDIVLEHPSISRYHAVVQFRTGNRERFYLYDLDSTHGTCVNKQQVQARSYKRLRVGYMVKFGGSTRNFILEGPDDDQEDESDLTVTEIKELRKKQEEEARQREAEAKAKAEADKAKEDEGGVDWGLGDDAEDEDPSSENPFALAGNNEDLYIDDPKKTLRGWFEREGYELQYNVEEKGYSHFVCTVELPIDTASGAPAIAEASVKGKKKEAVIACALEACRILDQHGELRKSCHEARKRKEKNWEENDFYDSDEDTFLDRTGTIEKKREMRKKMARKEAPEVDTYDTLLEKLRIVEEQIGQVQAKLEESKRASERAENEADDSLEAFMSALKSRSLEDKTQRSRWRQELAGLLQERLRLTRVANIAKPAHLPPLTGALLKPQAKGEEQGSKKVLPMTGSLKNRKKLVMPEPERRVVACSSSQDDEEEEEEDEQDEKKDGAKDSAGAKSEAEASHSTDVAMDEASDDNKTPSSQTTDEQVEKDAAKSEDKSPSKADTEEAEKKPVIIGPERPPMVLEFVKKTSKIIRTPEKKNKESQKKKKHSFESSDDYVGWLPPEGQSGDGKTHLNAKYGY